MQTAEINAKNMVHFLLSFIIMAFNVFFRIKRNGRPVSNGILVYEKTIPAQSGRLLRPDPLDDDGEAQTEWHSDWSNESVDVYCHTDGKNRGKPAFVARVTLKSGAEFDLSVR